MRTRPVLLVSFALSAAACSTTRHHTTAPRLPAGSEVTLQLRDHGGPTGGRLEVTPAAAPDGTLAWTHEQTSASVEAGEPVVRTTTAIVAPAAIERIEVAHVDRGRGALEGMGIGALAGLGAGLASAGLVALSGPSEDDYFSSGTLALVIGAPIMTVTGAAVGAAIGAIVGHRNRDVYEASPVPTIGVAPTTDGVAATAGWRF